MKSTSFEQRLCGRPRRSLEQKIMLLVRRYREAERRRRRNETAGANTRCRIGVPPNVPQRSTHVNSARRRMSLCRKSEKLSACKDKKRERP